MGYIIIGASSIHELQQEVTSFLSKIENKDFILQGGVCGDNKGYYQAAVDIQFNRIRSERELLKG